ncbi:hypothetical protein SAY86_023895 [Trapa natans]|uniref:TF-B3 domain-containing protein n=1 Tax=Trapa natans TaxID=22666 RepID=A0AAN7R9R1_TRANT|nr:hypothetical protein SAY86_023895 [Trapa natans]
MSSENKPLSTSENNIIYHLTNLHCGRKIHGVIAPSTRGPGTHHHIAISAPDSTQERQRALPRPKNADTRCSRGHGSYKFQGKWNEGPLLKRVCRLRTIKRNPRRRTLRDPFQINHTPDNHRHAFPADPQIQRVRRTCGYGRWEGEARSEARCFSECHTALPINLAQLWQLMITKSRLSPFANTKARRQKKGKQDLPRGEKSETKKLEKWSLLIDAANLSHRKVLLPVKKLQKSLQFSSELHHTLYGFIIFEVEWDSVRGINYLNELLIDTILALEAKLMKRWEFDNIAQAASSMPLWFKGTLAEHQILKNHLSNLIGDVFYHAEEEFPRTCYGGCEESSTNSSSTWENYPCNAGSCSSVSSAFDNDGQYELHSPSLKRSKTKFSQRDREVDFGSNEQKNERQDSMDMSLKFSTANNSVENFEYRDILIIFRFNDHDLPFKLKQIFVSDLRLLTLLEAGLPSWVILLQSYPIICHIYRPWMCPLARMLYAVISVITVLIGFYDLYKNVPVLKATAAHLCGPLFYWIETWEMVSRIQYLGTMLFLHNCRKALKYLLVMINCFRSFFSIISQPFAGPILELLHSLYPLWNATYQAFYTFFSIISVAFGSIYSLVTKLVELFLQPLWLVLTLISAIGNSVLHPIFQMLSDTLCLAISMVLALADTVASLWTCLHGSIKDVWQYVRGIWKLASSTNTAVNHTYEVSKWRSLWNDLFSQVFRALSVILNGFVSFFIACNRHRLSIYNHTEATIEKLFHRIHTLNSRNQPPSRQRLNLQPRSPVSVTVKKSLAETANTFKLIVFRPKGCEEEGALRANPKLPYKHKEPLEKSSSHGLKRRRSSSNSHLVNPEKRRLLASESDPNKNPGVSSNSNRVPSIRPSPTEWTQHEFIMPEEGTLYFLKYKGILLLGENIPMPTGKKHMFFKVFLLCHSTLRMKIPPAFRVHMKGKSSGTVYLMGPSRNRWIVKLIEDGGQLYLGQGWPSFVKDHDIQEGHYLVFKFDKPAETFKVKVFKPSGCEDERALRAKTKLPNKHKESLKKSSSHGLKVKEEEDDSSSKEKGTQPLPSTLTYPSFFVGLKGSDVRHRLGATLGIPVSFFRAHMFHFTDPMTGARLRLRWENKEWPATVTIWRNRVHLLEGWLDFVRESKVQAGVVCKFELLDPYLLRVNILKF